MRKNLFVVFAILLVASMVLSACAPSATPAATAAPTAAEAVAEATATEAMAAEPTATEAVAAPTADAMAMYAPAAVKGDIVTAGSSTVFPLSERMKQRFEEEGFAGKITVDSIGTGAGFERFCKTGETDISNASRKIKDSEVESCKALANPREPVAFQVGIDALSIVVSKENDFVKDVTLEELAKIFSTAEKWSDVRKEWPAEPIQRFIPGTDSGTFDYFVEAVMAATMPKGKDGKADIAGGEKAILAAKNTQASEDDNVLVQGVEGSKYAIGFFGFAYYQENATKLNVVSVNGIAPTAETAEAGTYPISRPLFIYSTAKIMQEKAQVAAFIYFYITAVEKEIQDVGYFPVSAAKATANMDAWKAATGGAAAAPAATATTAAAAAADPMYAPAAVKGDIVTAGSSTVFPLSERMKQRFEEEGFAGKITVDSIGTGAGFERFCKTGETDISNASRKIKDSEVESCKALANPREPIAFQVGIDALSIVVSKENDFVKDVTLEELAKIFSTAEKWSDVRKEWPAEPIQRFIPGTDSGTFDYFVEAVMAATMPKGADGKADIAGGEKAILAAKNTQASEDDNVLVQGVEGSKYAIGFFGFAYYQENATKLNVVSVNGIAPTAETAEAGTYPISRPLFIYSTAKIMQEKAQVAAFIYFYITAVENEIQDVGYFPVSAAKAAANMDAWKAATTK